MIEILPLIKILLTLYKPITFIFSFVLKLKNLFNSKKEILCIDFINSICKTEYYTKDDYCGFKNDDNKYQNTHSDFSAYTKSGITFSLLSLLRERDKIENIEPSKHDNIIKDIKTIYPKIYKELERKMSDGYCYKYDIQKIFKVKVTHKNPYNI